MPRPKQPGLTENELEVMQILWAEAPLTVTALLEALQRKPKPAYTSLLTLVQIMEKKGYIKHTKIGKAYAYLPILQRKKFLLTEVKRIAKRLFDGSPGKLVLNLVENEHLTSAELKTLKELLRNEKDE